MKYLIIAILFLVTGCINNIVVNVDPVKNWEGHFNNTNDFYNATRNIQLNADESIWVLSNTTLNRVLKNIERK